MYATIGPNSALLAGTQVESSTFSPLKCTVDLHFCGSERRRALIHIGYNVFLLVSPARAKVKIWSLREARSWGQSRVGQFQTCSIRKTPWNPRLKKWRSTGTYYLRGYEVLRGPHFKLGSPSPPLRHLLY
jgi:hypothetical protein